MMTHITKKEFDDRFYQFGKKLAFIEDSLLSIKKDLKDSIEKYSQSLQEHISSQEFINKYIKNKISETENCVNKANLEISRVDSKEVKESSKISTLFDAISILKKEISELPDYSKHIKNNLTPISGSLDVMGSKILDCQKDICSIKKDFESSSKSLGKEVFDIKSICNIVSQTVHEESEKNEKFKSVFNKFAAETSSYLSINKQSILDSVEKKLSNIKVSIPENVATKEQLKSIEDKLELVALDAKNAYLKSSQSESLGQITSKKLENLNLLVKQIETTRG